MALSFSSFPSLVSLLFGRRKSSAQLAKQRLQSLLAAELATRPLRRPDYLPALQLELLAVAAKYARIQSKDVRFSFERDRTQAEVLKVKITLSPAPRG